jgi:hypothetical protein
MHTPKSGGGAGTSSALFIHNHEMDITTGFPCFTVCLGDTAKPQKHMAKVLPCTAHGIDVAGKKLFALCLLSGTRPCAFLTLGKK